METELALVEGYCLEAVAMGMDTGRWTNKIRAVSNTKIYHKDFDNAMEKISDTFCLPSS